MGVAGLLLAAGLLTGTTAGALTLGDLVVQSLPGQPLRAYIPMTLEEGEELAQISAALATAEAYAEQRRERPMFLEGMRFSLLDKGERRARVQLYSEQPWQGEEAMLLLQLNWPGGLVSQPFRITGVTPAGESGKVPRYVEVGENDTLDAVAMRLSRGSNRSYLYMMYALFKTNPDGFYNGNMNNLKHGVRLRVPSEAELYQLSDAEVFGGIREQYSQWREQRQSAQGGSEAGAALAGMSNEEAAALAGSESPEALRQQFNRLATENEAIQQRNSELKARLARLEQQMQRMTEKVLDYPEEQPADPPGETALPTPADDKPAGSAAPQKPVEGLPSYLLPLLILLALVAGILVWRNAMCTKREGG
jgi:FimV-like protein